MDFLSYERVTELWTEVKMALKRKQDILVGTKEQLVGFDENGNVSAKKVAIPGGVATLGLDGVLEIGQRPSLAEIKGGSNPNLLDNWYFIRPINQNRRERYTSQGYSFDRWYVRTDGLTVLPQEHALRFLFTSNTGAFNQRIEHPESLFGKVITVSALVTAVSFAEGNVGVRIGLVSANSVTTNSKPLTGQLHKNTPDLVTYTARLPDTIPYSGINFELFASGSVSNGDYLDIAAVKLEFGSHQTLAHKNTEGEWELNGLPPDQALELSKCQRYQLVFSGSDINQPLLATGYTINTTTARFLLDLPSPLRTTPAISATNLYVNLSGIRAPVTAAAVLGPPAQNKISIQVTCSNANFAANQACFLEGQGDYRLILDANL